MSDCRQNLIEDDTSVKIIEIAKKLTAENGAHTVTVKKITSALGATNRVFYNRFRNVDEVLGIVYKNAVYEMHDSINTSYKSGCDIFEYAMDVAVKVLTDIYDIKKQFSKYVFEHDSLTESNLLWWTKEISEFIEYAMSNKFIRNTDSKMLSYSVWCLCRGYSADAIARNLSKEHAVKCFRFGFGCFLDGLRNC